MHQLTDQQRQELLKNPNVKEITKVQIHYTSKFKIWAVEKKLAGYAAKDIFQEAGINPNYFVTKYCQSCIKRWHLKYKKDGKKSLESNLTGKNATGRPRLEDPRKLSYNDLLAVVKIQKELIEELKKKKALAPKK